MKHVSKIRALLVALSAFWISLLQTSVLPDGYAWVVSFGYFFKGFLLIYRRSFFLFMAYWFFLLLPIYFIVSLVCYGILMVGVGLIRFLTCPHEAILLQEDTVEAKGFLKGKGVDISSD